MYLGEIFHVDTKRLQLRKGENKQSPRNYLFVGIDDYSRELYAEIYGDKSQFSSASFLQDDVLAQVPYTIECIYSDNCSEYKGTPDHAFVGLCMENKINQKCKQPI